MLVFQITQQQRNAEVTQVLEMRHSIEPICAAGITRHENEIACAHTLRRPFEVVLRMDRLIIFVNTEQREVEIVAWIFEVVRITAQERNLKFRRED